MLYFDPYNLLNLLRAAPIFVKHIVLGVILRLRRHIQISSLLTILPIYRYGLRVQHNLLFLIPFFEIILFRRILPTHQPFFITYKLI